MSGPNLTPAAEQLRAIVESLEGLMDERADINAEIRDRLKEAKGNGFDPKVIRVLIKRREEEPATLIEADALLESYEAALGCGAAAAGILSATRGPDGTFEVKMIAGDEAAEAKLTKPAAARRDARVLAELARQAREA